jgi:hypothetical protein
LHAGEPSTPEDASPPVPPPSPLLLVDASLASCVPFWGFDASSVEASAALGFDASTTRESLALASEGAAAPSPVGGAVSTPPHATMADHAKSQGRRVAALMIEVFHARLTLQRRDLVAAYEQTANATRWGEGVERV